MGSRARMLGAAVVSAVAVLAFSPAPAFAATYSAPLRTAVANLAVATEVRTGYDRDLFPHWIDADGDRCNTRYEVLIAEAVVAPAVTPSCALSGGRWYSYYDNRYWTAPADLDIDHVVALAEAWDSGARTWTTTQRRSFANDLGDSRGLVAVTDNVNQAKGDRDPAGWQPRAAYRCTYARMWIRTKYSWGLTVQGTERAALTAMLDTC